MVGTLLRVDEALTISESLWCALMSKAGVGWVCGEGAGDESGVMEKCF